MKIWGISHVAFDQSDVLSEFLGRCRFRSLRLRRTNFLSRRFCATDGGGQRAGGVGDGIVRRVRQFVLLFSLWANPATAQDPSPLSAIDWLSDSVNATNTSDLLTNQPATTQSAAVPSVRVTSLDSPSPNTIGILSSDKDRLPSDLWASSDEARLVELISTLPVPRLPALRDLLVTMLILEAEAPFGSTPEGHFYLARVDKLLDMARLEEARSLLAAGDIATPSSFRRFFDVSLLTATEDEACRLMEVRPTVAPTYPARIYCLARSGDWPAAALTLNTRRALGDISDEDELLLSLFLDPEVVELQAEIPPPSRVTPLVFRMREAIGEGLTTVDLPLAFAHTDLTDTKGWKVQLDAAERLARQGAIDANVLLELYTRRRASASGGVWNRVKAIQAFDNAVASQNQADVADTLPAAYDAMGQIDAEVALAKLFEADLAQYQLTGSAKQASSYLSAVNGRMSSLDLNDVDPFLAALVEGRPQEIFTVNRRRLAIQAAFNGSVIPEELMTLLRDGKRGEALLQAMTLAGVGLDGDLNSMTHSIAVMRLAGLEMTARQVSLQYLILEEN